MKVKLKKKTLYTIIIIIFFIIFTIGYFSILFKSSSKKTSMSETSYTNKENKKALSAITKLKSENDFLEYESTSIKEFTSLVFKNENKYESYIINNEGEELGIEDIIKEGKLEDFHAKEKELLELKYPKFIVDTISNNAGKKIYYVKDNEIIIYYYDYVYPYPLKETISLRINNNEIKNYLNYTFLLDKTYENENGYDYNANKKAIAFTFDDGPSYNNNPKILKVLSENKAHATFFMIGNLMERYQSRVLDTYKSGNEVASHSYEHMNLKKNPYDQAMESIQKANEVYYKITGDNIKYLRPPYGTINKEILGKTDLACIMWNLDTEDWRYHNKDHIVNYIMDNLSDGSIVLMHEIYGTTVEAIEEVLPRLYAEGYQVVSISELVKMKNADLKNNLCYRSFK